MKTSIGERFKKGFVCLVLIPFLWGALLVAAVIVLMIPMLGFIYPEKIEINKKEKK